ncbi:MAG TPA: hypothetical protein ENI87_11495, partial [bacterium]|nr:hypothetical protein [bacterium]
MRTTRGVNIGAAVALGAVTALGQAPDPWAELTLPQPVAANALRGQGKLLTYDEGTTLHVYSSLTRTWHSTAKSVAAPMRLFNDCLVVIEPGFCRAFSAYTGSFADRVVAATAIVRNAGGHNNDSIVLVASGSELHAFSAFTGEWTTRTMGAGFGVSVERHTAMFLDGTTIGGMSAFDGQWREHVAAAPVTAMSADGTAAVCRDVNTAYGFSAHDPKWKTAPLPLGAAFDRGDDWALWYGGGGTLAFSGLTGQFASSNASPSAVAGKTDLYALLGV